ncbi:signal peptide peptidase SppA [Neolewinella agarilytica]|uniref:Signal peptide peptidase A. Serine peptidase. MEROPS family S49 n=1 Tax=Neolewinella agarilytica TaxID=478744 RepID=A0A1H9NVC2_9BACT|nr:signal peptide peptidase SppA [Neolewinella agarilytica]SER39900.1 signal peptide peptidase A. Serine peptidase. MEROPS family S49 [Neolewinella agarilytica]
MSNFFKILLGSCLGTAIALIAMFFIGFSAIVGLASSGEQKPKVEANSILTLDLASVPELTGNAPLDGGFGFDFDTDEVVGLHDVVRSIEKAKTDDNIKGIYLSSMTNGVAYTSLRTVRQALEDFRESGKFVVSYAPLYEQRAYYLASAADEVYMGPLGAVDFRGLGAEIPFYKNMLDKVGIKFEIFYAGDFKSATEPYRRTEISDNNRVQTRQYLEGLMKYMLQDIGASRNIDPAQLRTYADEITGWKDQAAVEAGLIDGIKRRTEVDARLHELVGFDMDQKLKTIDLQDYFEARMKKLKGGGSSEVAVLIAEGSIVDGKGDLGAIGDKKYVDEIERLTEDDDVKAVVLRVNSGGGSASSSENIWYAAEQLKAAGKPFVVSMGDYAASGGYYVAAGADSIFAEPTTITGSIGVFMMFPIVKELMNDKIGINFDTVNTARNSNAFSTFRGLGDEERTVLKARTEMIYNTFLQRVADGRDIPLGTVKEIAGGRVYTGERAIEIGLVDRLGGLDEAIRSAANLASLESDDYSVGHYPRIKPPLEQLIEDLLGEDAAKGFGNAALKDQLGEENYEYFQLIRETTRAQGAQARMTEMVKF